MYQGLGSHIDGGRTYYVEAPHSEYLANVGLDRIRCGSLPSHFPPSIGSWTARRRKRRLTHARTWTAFRHARSDRVQERRQEGMEVGCHRPINNKKSGGMGSGERGEDSFLASESRVEWRRSAHHVESGHDHAAGILP